jgi:hypothetical protein
MEGLTHRQASGNSSRRMCLLSIFIFLFAVSSDFHSKLFQLDRSRSVTQTLGSGEECDSGALCAVSFCLHVDNEWVPVVINISHCLTINSKADIVFTIQSMTSAAAALPFAFTHL